MVERLHSEYWPCLMAHCTHYQLLEALLSLKDFCMVLFYFLLFTAVWEVYFSIPEPLINMSGLYCVSCSESLWCGLCLGREGRWPMITDNWSETSSVWMLWLSTLKRAVTTECQRDGFRKVVGFELPLRGNRIYGLTTNAEQSYSVSVHQNNLRIELKILGWKTSTEGHRKDFKV